MSSLSPQTSPFFDPATRIGLGASLDSIANPTGDTAFALKSMLSCLGKTSLDTPDALE